MKARELIDFNYVAEASGAEVEMGADIEFRHLGNWQKSRRLSKRHLKADPGYYKKLRKARKRSKSAT